MPARGLVVCGPLSIALLLVTQPVHADSLAMVGVLMLVAVVVAAFVAAEVLIFIVEFLVYRFALGLDWKRAVLSSLAANAASCGLGIALAVCLGYWVDPAQVVPGWVCLVGGAVVTLAVEVPLVAAMNRDFANRGRLLWTAAITNLATYLGASLALASIAT